MTAYDDLAGQWTLVSWKETEDCEEQPTRTTDRTRDFAPFRLDLTYPPPPASATGTLSQPGGAPSPFDWTLYGNPATSIQFRRVRGRFHRFERQFDYELTEEGQNEYLTLRRCWSEVHETGDNQSWIIDAMVPTAGFLARFGLPGILLSVIIWFVGIPIWLPIYLAERLIRRLLRWMQGLDELHCTRCEEIVFVR